MSGKNPRLIYGREDLGKTGGGFNRGPMVLGVCSTDAPQGKLLLPVLVCHSPIGTVNVSTSPLLCPVHYGGFLCPSFWLMLEHETVSGNPFRDDNMLLSSWSLLLKKKKKKKKVKMGSMK